jgi:hypothetical protein
MKFRSQTVVPSPSRPTQKGANPTPWLLALTLAASVLRTPFAFAAILDDFENPTRTESLWAEEVYFGVGGCQITNGQAILFITPDGDDGLSSLLSTSQFTIKPNHTLEFRADLIRTSGDGALARLGFTLLDGSGGYIVWLDKDTIAVSKRPDPLQLLFLRNGTSIKAANVKLVMSITATSSAVLLQVKVLDNANAGAVLFRAACLDTPGSDPMQVGTDNPPANFLGLAGRFRLGLYHDNAQLIDPFVEIPRLSTAEVVFDNAEVLEYDSAWAASPSAAMLISWPENTAENQILVAADTVANSVWTPWPEPIFNRFGCLCMAVPTTAKQQYFKLVPGIQFNDDFSPSKPPVASKSWWTPFFMDGADATRFIFTNVGSAFRIYTRSPAVDGQVLLLPPGPDVIVGDFYASVDILTWPVPGMALGIFARGLVDRANFPGATDGYIGNVVTAYGQIRIWDGENPVIGPAIMIDPAAHYRVAFSGTGTLLSLRLENLTTGDSPQSMSTRLSRWSQGPVGLFIRAEQGGSIDITLDNFFVTGTHP